MKQQQRDTTPLVPALDRGIRLVRELETSGPAPLHALAARCGIPKPSALRLLRTLAAQGIVRYDSGAKAYRLAMRLVPVAEPGSDLSARVAQTLERLSRDTGDTAEWYAPSESGMVLAQRHEPPGDIVRVVARVGFVRAWHGELDAVACVALAHDQVRRDARARFWTYDERARRVPLAQAEVSRRLANARASGWAADRTCNPHGVRRTAAAVTAGGALAGVLAIAAGYRPGRQTDTSSRQALVAAAHALSA